MNTIRKIVESGSSSKLTVTIDIPENYANRKLEVVVSPVEEKGNEPIKSKYDFSDLAGKLQWEGDPVAEQRRLRDEWD